MPSGSSDGRDAILTPAERTRLADIRAATDLADLTRRFDADSEHDAYFAAKRDWYDLREKELASVPRRDGLPGDCVTVDGHAICVHGITHADTPAEERYLREHVSRLLDGGATVYCEQGVRRMYFDDVPGVYAMDDYRWAMNRCRDADVDAPAEGFAVSEFEGLLEDVDSLAEEFREAAFTLIESGSDVYGERFGAALGDVASGFLTTHEDLATGEDFESFRKTRRAAENPERLVDLQRYYAKRFLPQPLEREWLRRHDRQLELVTHARNERMADYAVYHAEGTRPVHLIVGAAHQPGVVYYLERHRAGERDLDGFELSE
ncbi:hypothetical protein G9464_03485 [Halostella sp. JP-L12]|uniref:hypothetical protein n=1 Tax=Halostella TaxID=1843185 RepID=UPI000EF76C9F|nr:MULTISPECIES: hypothetical protein [Halostella]NHN46658.1 hypothetical protein [Halostella sp. JP-L12]